MRDQDDDDRDDRDDDRYTDEAPRRKRKKQRSAGVPENDDGPVLTHADTKQPKRADYFEPPPEEIGEVVTASTTLTEDKEPIGGGTRVLITVGSGLAGVVAACGVVALFKGDHVAYYIVWSGIVGGLAMIIAAMSTGFSHTCTYVGRDGVAKFTCSGSRRNVTEEVFCFREATELRTSQTRRYTNGVYQGTDYSYVWTDVTGRKRYTIAGTHNSEAGNPAPLDLYHYATAAELAWSYSQLADAERQVQIKGEARFNLGGRDFVAVGPDLLTLSLGGKVTECDVEDVGSVTIEQGVFTVRRVDAKEGWFTSKGVFKFDYSKLANAQLFLFVLKNVAGISIG